MEMAAWSRDPPRTLGPFLRPNEMTAFQLTVDHRVLILPLMGCQLLSDLLLIEGTHTKEWIYTIWMYRTKTRGEETINQLLVLEITLFFFYSSSLSFSLHLSVKGTVSERYNRVTLTNFSAYWKNENSKLSRERLLNHFPLTVSLLCVSLHSLREQRRNMWRCSRTPVKGRMRSASRKGLLWRSSRRTWKAGGLFGESAGLLPSKIHVHAKDWAQLVTQIPTKKDLSITKKPLCTVAILKNSYQENIL